MIGRMHTIDFSMRSHQFLFFLMATQLRLLLSLSTESGTGKYTDLKNVQHANADKARSLSVARSMFDIDDHVPFNQ